MYNVATLARTREREREREREGEEEEENIISSSRGHEAHGTRNTLHHTHLLDMRCSRCESTFVTYTPRVFCGDSFTKLHMLLSYLIIEPKLALMWAYAGHLRSTCSSSSIACMSLHILHILSYFGMPAHAPFFSSKDWDLFQIFFKLERCVRVRGAVR